MSSLHSTPLLHCTIVPRLNNKVFSIFLFGNSGRASFHALGCICEIYAFIPHVYVVSRPLFPNRKVEETTDCTKELASLLILTLV